MENEGIYDCVITNIPFSQNIDLNTSAYYYNGLAKKSGDGVCILHCLKSIKKGGRMALIVPEGVLFKKTLAPVRRFLLENAKLETVISLPQGIFLPYTGVKTSILYFTGCHENSTKEGVWFYEVKNDGFTLNNHRRPIELNDLKYIDYVDFSNNKSLHTDIPLTTNSLGETLGFQKVEYGTIKENDYNLIFNRYSQTSVSRFQSSESEEWEMVRLVDICETLDKKRKPLNGEIRKLMEGQIPYYGANGVVDYINDYIFNEKLLLLAEDGGFWGDNQQSSYLIEAKSWVNNHAHVLKFEQDVTRKFVHYTLNDMNLTMYITGSTRGKLTLKDLKRIEIPLPPLHIQQKIVEELDNIQEGIDAGEKLIACLKKQLNLDSFRFAHHFDNGSL